MTINQKQRNLERLITCQLDFVVLADMEDLEIAIIATNVEEELLQKSNQGSVDMNAEKDPSQAENVPSQIEIETKSSDLFPGRKTLWKLLSQIFIHCGEIACYQYARVFKLAEQLPLD